MLVGARDPDNYIDKNGFRLQPEVTYLFYDSKMNYDCFVQMTERPSDVRDGWYARHLDSGNMFLVDPKMAENFSMVSHIDILEQTKMRLKNLQEALDSIQECDRQKMDSDKRVKEILERKRNP